MASEKYSQVFSPGNEDSFTLLEKGMVIEFLNAPNGLGTALVRAKVLELATVRRPGEFAKAVLAANFFWGGTRGATLSIDDDNSLWLTERHLIDDLADMELLESCLADFVNTITDWRDRSLLYG